MKGIDLTRLAVFALVVFALAAFGGMPRAAEAAPPWFKLLSFERVEADPDKAYPLDEENGPWMIMACSFSGEGAERQARELVHELRKRYKLPAYTYRRRFEFGATAGRGIDRFGEPLRMRYRLDELKEIAVLVGDFSAVDDPDAQKTLEKLKHSHPRCLDVKKRERTNQSLAGWRTFFREHVLAPGSKHRKTGPLSHAFITTNPLLPEEYFNRKGLDPLVLEMNKDVPHSLLDCPGKYTVQVATFKGNVLIAPREIEAVENGKKVESKLAEAAEKAHTLTEALRVKGWEAYEFHDRYASIVTVGSFDSMGRPRADGKTEINPRIHTIMQTFGAQPVPGAPAGITPVNSLVGIPFDVQPIPVKVPKRSIAQEAAARP